MVMDEATDRNGRILSRQVIKHLNLGCVAHAVVSNPEAGAESIYSRITKTKDGTFWGIAREVLGAHKRVSAHSSLNGGARLGT